MNTEYLHELCVLAETLNFHEAAKQLCVSQSTLSRHITALELHYGVPLFRRDKHQVGLTEAGTLVLDYARSIYALVRRSEDSVASLFADNFVILCGGILNHESLYSITEETQRRLKDVDTRYNLRINGEALPSPAKFHEILQENEVDYIIAFNAQGRLGNDANVSIEPIAQWPLVATVTRQNPLAQLQSITADMLQGRCFAQFTGPMFSEYWQAICHTLSEGGIAYSSKPIPAMNFYDITQAVGGLGDVVYLAPFRSIPTSILKNPDLATIPIDSTQLPLIVEVAYLPEKDNELTTRFIEALRQAYQQALAESTPRASTKA